MDDDVTSRISQILGDPASMEKLRSLAAMFGDGSGQPAQSAAPQPPQSPQQRQSPQPQPQRQPAPAQQQNRAPMDPELMRSVMKLAPLFSNMHREDDSTRLLRALRPFLGEPRRRKLDEAVRLMQLIRMVPILKSGGLFQS